MLKPYLEGIETIEFSSLRIMHDRFNKIFPNTNCTTCVPPFILAFRNSELQTLRVMSLSDTLTVLWETPILTFRTNFYCARAKNSVKKLHNRAYERKKLKILKHHKINKNIVTCPIFIENRAFLIEIRRLLLLAKYFTALRFVPLQSNGAARIAPSST